MWVPWFIVLHQWELWKDFARTFWYRTTSIEKSALLAAIAYLHSRHPAVLERIVWITAGTAVGATLYRTLQAISLSMTRWWARRSR